MSLTWEGHSSREGPSSRRTVSEGAEVTQSKIQSAQNTADQVVIGTVR